MMKVKMGEREYDIQWRYEVVLSARGKIGVIRTTCTASFIDPYIEKGREKYVHIMSASVTQNPIDQHSKKIARKLSLAKMLRVWLGIFPESKALRAGIWKTYFTKIKS